MAEVKFLDGGMSAVQGFKSTGIHCGIKRAKKDLAIIYSQEEAVAAGVFTQNKVAAAPVILTKEHLEATGGKCKAIIVNSGNANACTGTKGLEDARMTASLAAQELGVDEKEILVSSTGVIGVYLPMDKISQGIKNIWQDLQDTNNSQAAAEGIMTTDTFPKEVLVETVIDGKTVKIGGIAKGSGMIHPNMATMLSFIVTDINIGLEMIKEALKEVVDVTFNMISVDGDTSTNDMVLVMANGLAGNKMINEKNKDYHAFKEALFALCFKLAELIIRDGEGATKFVTVKVKNAQTLEDARLAARSITTSNLVKTALFGEDANWGRVIAAIGYSGAAFDPNQVNMYIESARGSQQMMEKGMGLPFDEEKAKAILKEKDITLIVDLVSGFQEATAWTCDFSYDYVKINAEYRS